MSKGGGGTRVRRGDDGKERMDSPHTKEGERIKNEPRLQHHRKNCGHKKNNFMYTVYLFIPVNQTRK
jgi:hypothetical protein